MSLVTRRRLIGSISALLLGVLLAAPVQASAQSPEDCAPRVVSVEELPGYEKSCDLTGWTVVTAAGTTLVVPAAGISVTSSSSSDGSDAAQPDASLFNSGTGIAVREGEQVVYATTKEDLAQLDRSLRSTPGARHADADELADGIESQRSGIAPLSAAQLASGKCSETAPYTLNSTWAAGRYQWFWNRANEPFPDNGTWTRVKYGADSIGAGWTTVCPTGGGYPVTGPTDFLAAQPGVTATGCGSQDLNNVVGMGPLDGGTLGRTCSWNTVLGYKAEADIKFDTSSRSWHWSPSTSGCAAGSFDIEGVAVHEFGHAVGLGHVDDQTQVMRETIASCDFSWRDLGRGDQRGLLALQGIFPPL